MGKGPPKMSNLILKRGGLWVANNTSFEVYKKKKTVRMKVMFPLWAF